MTSNQPFSDPPTLEFGKDANGKTLAKADFQQLGNGFGGHQWFAYTRKVPELVHPLLSQPPGWPARSWARRRR
ncbi:hypothetical protein GCM10009555_042470 [Acrocarpospora macrocephala]|uniref:hypothetical protein n=1 Tax=Acrocarpospora macrocephala TaxID=150177 RepID=UPI0012D32D16|nr:hypothetical protein [Acrocarpospora macrocephala]